MGRIRSDVFIDFRVRNFRLYLKSVFQKDFLGEQPCCVSFEDLKGDSALELPDF